MVERPTPQRATYFMITDPRPDNFHTDGKPELKTLAIVLLILACLVAVAIFYGTLFRKKESVHYTWRNAPFTAKVVEGAPEYFVEFGFGSDGSLKWRRGTTIVTNSP